MKTKENKMTPSFEIATIAAIMADNITKKLYDKCEIGYMATVEQIAKWAVEFYKKHKKTDWVELIENGMKPLSGSICSIDSWEDAVYDFAIFKLTNI